MIKQFEEQTGLKIKSISITNGTRRTSSQATLYYIGSETAFNVYTQKCRRSKENVFISNTFRDSFEDLLSLL